VFDVASIEARNLDSPDETRTFDKGRLDLVELSGAVIGRARFEPGWRWSECVKPIAGTASCEAGHTGYVLEGHLHIVMDDGTEGEAGPGDAFVIAPGHDAWVVGDEPCVALDWSGVADYAKR
jgi:hypothetical protein